MKDEKEERGEAAAGKGCLGELETANCTDFLGLDQTGQGCCNGVNALLLPSEVLLLLHSLRNFFSARGVQLRGGDVNDAPDGGRTLLLMHRRPYASNRAEG